jgi:uncharacterized protein YkwD
MARSTTLVLTDFVRRLFVVLTAVAALLTAVAVQARPAVATTPHGRTSYESAIGWAVQRQINAERHAHGLPALVMDSHLQLSARRHDMAMAHYNSMAHQLPGEAFFATRISQAGYHWTWAGENIAWNSQINTAGVEHLQSMMYNEEAPYNGHRLNILSTHFSNVGVDVYIDSTHHKVWLTTDFGRH